jgi:hypothetical protein
VDGAENLAGADHWGRREDGVTKAPYLAARITVLGHKWIVYFCSEEYWKKEKKFSNNVLGITDPDTKKIYLRQIKMTFDTIIHELHHAYIEELCVTPADLDTDQMEEVCSDLMAKYGKRLLDQADKLIATYARLKTRASS